jgi:quinol monooxygenase YgiN
VITTIVRHRVRDYDAWRAVYDSVGQLQREGGVSAQSVMRDAHDPNEVLVLHDFPDLATAEAFFAQDDLRAAMQRGGVEGMPRIEFYEPLNAGAATPSQRAGDARAAETPTAGG